MVEWLYGYDLFISYTREDDPKSAFALAIHSALTEGSKERRRRPMRCFLDLQDMPHDDELRRAIEEKISASRFVLIIAGVHSADHEWMCFEAEVARKHRKRIIILDRGLRWNESTSLLKQKVGNVRAIVNNPSLSHPGEAEIDSVSNAVGTLRRATVRKRIWLSLIIVLLAIGIVAASQRRRAVEAQRARLLQLGVASRSDEAAAEENLRVGHFGEALAYLARAIRVDPSNRTAQTQLWSAIVLPTHPFQRLPDKVWEKTNPNLPRKLSSTGGQMLWNPLEGGVELLTFPDRQRLAQIVLPKRGLSSTGYANYSPITYSRSCRWIVRLDEEQVLKFWDTRTGQLVSTIDKGSPLERQPLFPADDSAVGLSSDAGELRVWALPSGVPFPHFIRFDPKNIDEPMLSPGGRFFFARDFYNIPTLWDLSTGRVVMRDFVKGRPFVKAAFSGDGERLAMSWIRHRLYGQPEVLAETLAVWDCKTGQRCNLNWAPPDEFLDLQPSPDGPGWAVITDGTWMRYDVKPSPDRKRCNLESFLVADVGTEFSLPVMDRNGRWVCLRTKAEGWALFERRVVPLSKTHPLLNTQHPGVNYAIQRSGISAGTSRIFGHFEYRIEVFNRMILDTEGRHLFAESEDGSAFLWDLRPTIVGREASPETDPTAPFPATSSQGLELVEDGTGHLRVREKATAKWATQPFWKRSKGTIPRWSSDGNRLEYFLDDGAKSAIPLPHLGGGPSWIESFATAAGGFRFEENAQLQGVSLEERLVIRERLRTELANGRLVNDGDPAWERLLRWWLTPVGQQAAVP